MNINNARRKCFSNIYWTHLLRHQDDVKHLVKSLLHHSLYFSDFLKFQGHFMIRNTVFRALPVFRALMEVYFSLFCLT